VPRSRPRLSLRPTIGGAGRGEIDRIIYFSDAVFAIAITLLVIELAVPSTHVHDHDLTKALLALGPRYFSFALSFWIIGPFWVGHHLTFQFVRRWNSTLLSLNLLLLLCIGFLPFPTAVLGTHLSDAPAAVFYALSMAVTGMFSTALWWYVSGRHRLIDSGVPASATHTQLLRAATTPVLFLASIPAIPMFVNFGLGRVSLAVLVWTLGIPAVRIVLAVALRRRLEDGR
jgi:uncharacterized membrane protein